MQAEETTRIRKIKRAHAVEQIERALLLGPPAGEPAAPEAWRVDRTIQAWRLEQTLRRNFAREG